MAKTAKINTTKVTIIQVRLDAIFQLSFDRYFRKNFQIATPFFSAKARKLLKLISEKIILSEDRKK